MISVKMGQGIVKKLRIEHYFKHLASDWDKFGQTRWKIWIKKVKSNVEASVKRSRSPVNRKKTQVSIQKILVKAQRVDQLTRSADRHTQRAYRRFNPELEFNLILIYCSLSWSRRLRNNLRRIQHGKTLILGVQKWWITSPPLVLPSPFKGQTDSLDTKQPKREGTFKVIQGP